MNTHLLIEIGTEELPAIPFLKEEPFILQKFQELLREYYIDGHCTFFSTPRRLVIQSNDISTTQKNSTEEFFGPPLNVAYKNNQPTKAFESFLKRHNINQNDVDTTLKDGKEILYYKKETKGKETKAVLGEIITKFLNTLQFGKNMYWGIQEESFIRPIRSLIIMLDLELVPFELYGIQSKKATFVNRSFNLKPIPFNTQEEYKNTLIQNGVILSPIERKNKILKEIQEIEQKYDIHVHINPLLLDEIVAITEYPTVLLGYFDKHFLTIPQEVIVTSMEEHQRYFSIYKNDALLNAFIVVSNAVCTDYTLIIKGNEKVLKARLSDALFFYQNDLKNGFQSDMLKHVRFIEGLGSMAEKSSREEKIASVLNNIYQERLSYDTQKSYENIKSLIEQTAQISKADLISETVYEFTELQGVIGAYMAKYFGFDNLCCQAIKEQYLPKTHNDELPNNLFSALFALAYRLDNLFALFSVGKIPSGSKDPFSLRRAANGIIRIILHYQIPFDMKKIFPLLSSLYKNFDITILEKFILERMHAFYTINPSIMSAVVATNEKEICRIDKKIQAISALINKDNIKEISATFKRVAHIVKDIDINNIPTINTQLLNATEEQEIYKQFQSFCQQNFDDPKDEFNALMLFKPYLDRFFNNVLVNAPDKSLRENRKALIANIYKAFLNIADIKEISL